MTASLETVERIEQICRQAAEENRRTELRAGNVVGLTPEDGDDILVSADLHGQRLNFQNLCRIADLDRHLGRHFLIQEVCHGGPQYPQENGCMSHLMVEDVARLKVKYPERIHFIMSNHEMAEVADFPIAKAQRMLNLQFQYGIRHQYGVHSGRVRAAYVEFLGSCPLAVRLQSGVFLSHSLPDGVDRDGYDATVFERHLRQDDMLPDGAAFRLVWGRDYRAENSQAFAELVKAEVLIHGHEPCRHGYSVPNERQILLDSCGPMPSYVILPIGGVLSQRQIVERIKRLP